MRAVAENVVTDRQTDRLTHLRDNYRNPRCACAPRVNKQKRQYDNKSSVSKLKVNDRVMVHFPSAAQGKVWKLAQPYFGRYRIISLTPTNTEVQLVDQPVGATLFVAQTMLQ